MEYIFSRKSVKKLYKIYLDKDKNYLPKMLERLKLKLNKFEYEKYKRYFKYYHKHLYIRYDKNNKNRNIINTNLKNFNFKEIENDPLV